jgi:hypothetical protein
MWAARRAFDERIEYSELGARRWRATYRGFVSMAAEGIDPRDAQANLGEAFDVFLAQLIRTTHRPPAADEPGMVTYQDAAIAAVPGARTSKQRKNARKGAGI